ncbi:gamma carbonic anhydrase family protein [Georgenia thermotolerans]|uniref:Gamma carbonic anhydrase family protein n=1 Tax=Georgenia thermotolerans TaxID=527326 RepID=A0A7J5UV54_9MICO|nr:gamma carbonic anhydrase family protein [Georgenia thermotolerans]KAE8766181.1 gamma carbonic anhydrase family protein [Georgenia thermotolerans]
MDTDRSTDQAVRLRFDDVEPVVDSQAWVAPGAVLVGKVTLAADASVFYHAVLRGDMDTIDIGRGSNIQDGCIVHTDPGHPVRVGENVSVGHRAVLHGCTVEDDCLIGMGSVVLNDARIGRGSLVAAGAVVPEGMEVPPGSLVAGVPAKVRHELSEDQRARMLENSATYVALKSRHREAWG